MNRITGKLTITVPFEAHTPSSDITDELMRRIKRKDIPIVTSSGLYANIFFTAAEMLLVEIDYIAVHDDKVTFL